MDNFNFLSGIEVFSNLEWIQKTVLIRRIEKELKDLDYVKKVDFLDKFFDLCREYQQEIPPQKMAEVLREYADRLDE